MYVFDLKYYVQVFIMKKIKEIKGYMILLLNHINIEDKFVNFLGGFC